MRAITACIVTCALTFSHWAAAQAEPYVETANSKCLRLPTDPDWPNDRQWANLDRKVSGRLIRGRPLADVCHGQLHNVDACASIQAKWNLPETYFVDPINVMSPYWLNNSCSPFTPAASPCTLGNIASYAVNVTSWKDVAAAIKFAKNHRVRLTIKNTGHDFLGRSTGLGSLALWMHNLKSISFLRYRSAAYQGPAVKLGAGVQAYEAFAAAGERGLRVPGGFCPTVGIVGGYVQGAGHGPLEGLYGLAADNTLEFEVVTGEGKLVVASRTQNSDLYWALNGGGGGTYGVVISQTVKAHTDGPVAGASLTFNRTDDNSYWAAIQSWQEHLLEFDAIPGFTSFFGFTNERFDLYSGIFIDAEESDIEDVLASFISELKKLRIPYSYSTTGYPNFFQHIVHYTPGFPLGIYTTNSVLGGRLIPRSVVQNSLPKLINVFQNITSERPHVFRINGIASNVTHARVGNAPGSNAIIPAWRESLYWLNMDVYLEPTAPSEVMGDLQGLMNTNQDKLKLVTPRGGAYMNEATFDNVDWKSDYYGPNYEKLLKIKNKYDPNSLFYGPASVGSDEWNVAKDGRLCKASRNDGN
ncbi:VAO-type flavoprotein oxidase [Paramyrothecium foliicola]|nr:VAO-type flavoprotein oxidase [Paramyrothecium foliicola]